MAISELARIQKNRYERGSQAIHIIGQRVRQQPSVRSLLVGAGFCLFILAPVLATAQSEKVKVGLLMINADAGIFVAQDKGFFRDQGLTVELTYFSSSGGAQMAALTTGELDAGSGSISPGIYNSVAGGVNMRAVATWCAAVS